MRALPAHAVTMPTDYTRVALPDGRRLSYREYGDPAGTPVIYQHGTPSSSLEPVAFGIHAAAATHAVRLIAPDRPGMGRSDPHPRRRILDWSHDVRALADHLGLDRFAVLGYSGGVPFAAATAYRLPDRVSAAALVACVAHLAPGLDDGLHPDGLRWKELARTRPRLARIVLTLAVRAPATLAPRLLLARLGAGVTEPDRAVLARPGMHHGFVPAIREAFRQGAVGPQQDQALMSSAWGFDPGDIRVPVQLWQGTADTFGARPAMAHHLSDAIGNNDLHLTPDGHLSILVEHSDEILTGVLALSG